MVEVTLDHEFLQCVCVKYSSAVQLVHTVLLHILLIGRIQFLEFLRKWLCRRWCPSGRHITWKFKNCLFMKSDDRGGFEHLIGFCSNPLSGWGDMPGPWNFQKCFIFSKRQCKCTMGVWHIMDKYLEGCISKTTWPFKFDFKLETGYCAHTLYLY